MDAAPFKGRGKGRLREARYAYLSALSDRFIIRP